MGRFFWSETWACMSTDHMSAKYKMAARSCSSVTVVTPWLSQALLVPHVLPENGPHLSYHGNFEIFCKYGFLIFIHFSDVWRGPIRVWDCPDQYQREVLVHEFILLIKWGTFIEVREDGNLSGDVVWNKAISRVIENSEIDENGEVPNVECDKAVNRNLAKNDWTWH